MKSNSFNFKNKNKQNNENYLSNNTVSSNLNQNNMNNDYLNHENSNIHSQLINSLKEKIKVYEKDIENLIEEKLAMQIEINNYQIKKNQINTNIMNNSENIDKIIELNNQLNQQNFSMKNEINKLNSIIEKQNEIINNNNSQYKSNKNDFKCSNCEKKNEELIKMKNEKLNIMNAIDELKKQLEILKTNNKKKKKKKEEISKNESLPSIEQYFILNNKFQLVDKDFNLWHMKKCNKFIEFKEKNGNNFKNPEDLFKEFINYYENINNKECIEEFNNYYNNINEIHGGCEFYLNNNKNEDISLSLSDNSN